MNVFKVACASLSMHMLICTTACRSTYFVFPERKKGTEDSYVIEASTLQFDLHPINVPGIAFAQLEKIGFSG